MPKKYDYDILILGAGASGLMCASFLKGMDVAIIESNPSAGRKIRISGGGRCNLTNENVTASNYLGDYAFIEPVLKRFDQQKVLAFFEKRGVNPKIRAQGQYFCTNSSDEILSVFAKETAGIKKIFNCKIIKAGKKEHLFYTHTDNGIFKSKKLVVATGGLSYESIGASDIGLKIASGFGHNIITPKPALVGFTAQKEQFWFKELSGISFKAAISVAGKRFEDEILFAHKGISGPVVLNASLYWEKGKIKIDFLPEINLKKLFKNSKKQISSLLPLPKRFVKEFLQSIGMEDKNADSISKNEFEKLKILKEYEFSPAGNFGYTKAEATKGGVDTDEIDPQTMQSRKCEGLYFAGEAVNVTGELGGYNFQWAFSSGYVCSEALSS